MPSILLWFLNIQKNYVKGKTMLVERHYGRFSYPKITVPRLQASCWRHPDREGMVLALGSSHSLILPAGKKKTPYRCLFPY